MYSTVMSEALAWSAGLTLALPFLLIVMGELLLRLRRAKHPLVSPIAETRSVLLPMLATLVIMVKVIGLDFDAIPVRLVETLFWLIVVHAALSFLNAVLFARAKEGSWQARLPGLFVDLIRVVLVLVCAAIILSTVWGQDLRQLVTALGVGSIVIGLALQEPLGNLFSGIMLMIERPLSVGDLADLQRDGRRGDRDQLAGDPPANPQQGPDRRAELRRRPSRASPTRAVPAACTAKPSGLASHATTRPTTSSGSSRTPRSARPESCIIPRQRWELTDFAESTKIHSAKVHIADAGDNSTILDEFPDSCPGTPPGWCTSA